MKRKYEDTQSLPSTKKAKQDPKITVLNLIDKHQSSLTEENLNNVLKELTIEATHELLKDPKNNPILDKPGSNTFIKSLFSHLFRMDYTETGTSLQDFHTLISQYKEAKLLPRIHCWQLNKWLGQVNKASFHVKNLPFILQIIEQLALGRNIIFEGSDKIDLNLINNRLSAYVKKMSIENKELGTHIYWIIAALARLTMRSTRGELETRYIHEMLWFFLNQNPMVEEVDDTLFHVGIMLERHNFNQAISSTWLEKALLYINNKADSETISKRIVQFSGSFCNTRYRLIPLQAENLQPIFNRITEGNPTINHLSSRLNSFTMLVTKQLIHGSFTAMDAFFEKVDVNDLTLVTLHEIFNYLIVLSASFKNPLPVHLIEKLLIPEKLKLDIKDLSLAFNAVSVLANHSKISGQLTGNFLTLIDFVASSKLENLDEKVIVSALSAYGACLFQENLSINNNQTMDKLINQLIQLKKMNTTSLMHTFNAFRNIALGKEFKAEFSGASMTLLLNKFTTAKPSNSHVSICAYNLGIVAKQGCLKGTVSQITLSAALKTLLAFEHVKPTILFKCLIALSNLKAKHSLHDLEHDLENTFDRLISNTIIFKQFSTDDVTILRELDVADIEAVLQLPYQLREKFLNILMPMCLYILKNKLDIKGLKAINKAIDEQIETQSMPPLPVKYISYIFTIFAKLEQFYPVTFLNTLLFISKLLEKNLLEGELCLHFAGNFIQKIFNEDLLKQSVKLSYLADLLNLIDFLYYDHPAEMDILPSVFQLIVKNLSENKVPDRESISYIFQSVESLLRGDRIVFSKINGLILADILQVFIDAPDLQKDPCLLILAGVAFLMDNELIEGELDVTIVNNLLKQANDLFPAGLDEKLLDILHKYNQSNASNPKPGLIPQQLFYHAPEEKPFLKAPPVATFRNK